MSNWNIISLSATLLGCLWVLRGSLLARRGLKNQQTQKLTLAGLFGVAYVGLSAYATFGTFHSASGAVTFNFVEALVAGITVAMLISIFGPTSAKVVLVMSAMLLVGIDFLVIAHHAFRQFVARVRGFSSFNGLLLGILIPFIIMLWCERRKPTGSISEADDQADLS